MNETLGPPGQDPEYLTDTLTGPQFDEIAFHLLTHETLTLSVNGHRIVSIHSRAHSPETDIVTLTCRDDAGKRHEFNYTLDPGSTVSHAVLEEPEP